MKLMLTAIAAILVATSAFAGAPAGCVTITSVVPSSGTVGTQVVITGTGFASCCPFECPQAGVTFGGVPAHVVSWSDTQLVVTAPSAGPGAVNVTVAQISATATAVNAFTFVAGANAPALGPIAAAAVALLLITIALVRLR